MADAAGLSAADKLPRTQFGSVKFPSELTRLRFQFRHHVFEYPHSPGGSPEKLGRSLFRPTVRASFQNTFPAYPGLYPQGMLQMLNYAVNGATLQFTHPSAGSFPAFIINWDQEKEARLRSGEKVEIEFLEDQAASFQLGIITQTSTSTSMGTTAQALAQQLAAVQQQLAVTPADLSVFDALQNAVNIVTGFRDTAKLYGNRYAAAVAQVTSLCQQLSDQTQSMQDARAWPVVDIIKALWAQSVQVSNDLHSNQVQIQTMTVPFTQSLAQVAIFLYGDASRAGDLLALNSDVVDNVMRVRAGTTIRYYPLSNQQQAQLAAAA